MDFVCYLSPPSTFLATSIPHEPWQPTPPCSPPPSLAVPYRLFPSLTPLASPHPSAPPLTLSTFLLPFALCPTRNNDQPPPHLCLALRPSLLILLLRLPRPQPPSYHPHLSHLFTQIATLKNLQPFLLLLPPPSSPPSPSARHPSIRTNQIAQTTLNHNETLKPKTHLPLRSKQPQTGRALNPKPSHNFLHLPDPPVLFPSARERESNER